MNDQILRAILSIFSEPAADTLVNPKKAMNLNLVLQLMFCFCFGLASIFLSGFSNIGFQLIVTGLANITYCFGAFYVINKQPDPISVGACLGSGVVISILSIVTCVYWGELSKCEIVSTNIRKYTCQNKSAMRFMSIISFMLFILQVNIVDTVVLIIFDYLLSYLFTLPHSPLFSPLLFPSLYFTLHFTLPLPS